MALVGESGSGKSVSALSILKLLPYPTASHPSGSIRFKGRELLDHSERRCASIRGNDISIIFQEPMTSLNPLHTIESQIGEIMQLHSGITGARRPGADARTAHAGRHSRTGDAARQLSASTFRRPTPARHDRDGARQRAGPVDRGRADHRARRHRAGADLTLLAEIRARLGMSLLFITHDLGIVRRIADVVCVMNGGKIVEQGPVEQVFTSPKHPYTRALLAAEPKPDPAPPRPESPVVISADDLKVWFPVKRGLLR